ncbi:MAG: CRISPR-associated endonuclease Cas1, partial [Thermoplasmata archaeon]
MMYEGRIASAYWNELSKIFNQLAPDFRFETRKNLSYSWNMNASDPVNALLNYGYAILESMVRKDINTIGLDVSIGFLHEIA